MNKFRDLLTRFIPIFTLALFLTVASIGAFAGGVWGVVGIAGALALYLMTWIADGKMPRPDPCLMGMAFLTLALMALLNLHSTFPANSWFDWKRLAGVFLPLMLLFCPEIVARSKHPRLFDFTLLAAFAGIVTLSMELYLGGPLLVTYKGIHASLTEYNRGLSYLIILAFPIMASLWVTGRKKWIIPFILILLIPTSLTESRAAKLALIVALAVTATSFKWPRFTRGALVALCIACFGWAFAAQQIFTHYPDQLNRIPASWRARMEIWDYTSYRILEKPLLGWGLGAARSLDNKQPHGDLYLYYAQVPASHSHNVFTQLWVELGLPGLALGILFVILTLQKIGKLDAKLIPFATGAWAAALCLSLVAYNFWTDSLFAAFALSAYAFTMLKSREK